MSKSTSNNLSTISVALTLCLVCSILVSGIAVGLKPTQDNNAKLDMNKNILLAAGEVNKEATPADVEKQFKNFTVKLVNLTDGTFATEEQITQAGINVDSYTNDSAAKIPELSTALDNDTAGIGRIPKFAKVYIKASADGKADAVVLPIYGAGLWGRIYGFLTLESDMNTVKGISFYSHKETPGLGALIVEDKFRDQWPAKKSYDESGTVKLAVTKAGLAKEGQIDGVSGATITSSGVNNFVQFWLSDKGYKGFLDNLRANKAGEM